MRKTKKHFIIKSISRRPKWDRGVYLERQLFQPWNRNPIRGQIWNVHKGAIRRDRFIIGRGTAAALNHLQRCCKSPSSSSSASPHGKVCFNHFNFMLQIIFLNRDYWEPRAKAVFIDSLQRKKNFSQGHMCTFLINQFLFFVCFDIYIFFFPILLFQWQSHVTFNRYAFLQFVKFHCVNNDNTNT